MSINVTGPADRPRFAFSSVPALPEDEVLARLIFGRSMSNLSPLQIAQLADAAAQLSGGGGTTSLLEALRSNLGVDDLDIRTNEQGGTSVAVGKYLNDRTYLTLEKGDKAGSGFVMPGRRRVEAVMVSSSCVGLPRHGSAPQRLPARPPNRLALRRSRRSSTFSPGTGSCPLLVAAWLMTTWLHCWSAPGSWAGWTGFKIGGGQYFRQPMRKRLLQ